MSTPLTTNGDATTRDNWGRYTYGKERGHRDYLEQAGKCEGMYLGGGKQWSEQGKETLRRQGRPFYEFNEILPSVNSAVGYQIQNRLDIAFKPRGGDATSTRPRCSPRSRCRSRTCRSSGGTRPRSSPMAWCSSAAISICA